MRVGKSIQEVGTVVEEEVSRVKAMLEEVESELYEVVGGGQ